MSQMPDNIYLPKGAKYNTVGLYSAQSEELILSENDYDESIMNDYVEYIPVYRLEEAVMKVKRDIISLIESRLSEIIGDAQPKPALRAELQELIKKIKKDEK